MSRGVLLLTGAFDWRPEERKVLEDAGYRLLFLPNETDPLPPNGEQAETVVCNALFLHHPLERFPHLRTIQLLSAGLDRVNLEQVERRGIALYNAEDTYCVPMAEWILMRVLELYKRGPHLCRNQWASRWEKLRQLPELAGKRVLILGTGYVGRAAAKRFEAFEADVAGINRSGHSLPEFSRVFPAECLDERLPETDILVLALPLTGETRGMLDNRRLALLPRGAVVVNVARGAILDEVALAAAVQEGHLLGAVLDVFEQEPLPAESPLWGMEGILLSSHNSFVGQGNHDRLWRVIRKNLIQGVEHS